MHPTDAELTEFFDEFDHALAQGSIPIRAFNDASIHELELDRIFTARMGVRRARVARSPRGATTCSGTIGRDPFILVRGEDGEIRVLFDACRHRGAHGLPGREWQRRPLPLPVPRLDLQEHGQSWPARRSCGTAYGPDLDKSELGLLRRPACRERPRTRVRLPRSATRRRSTSTSVT